MTKVSFKWKQFPNNVEISGSGLRVLKCIESTNIKATRYAVMCLACHHEYTMSHESIKKRIEKKTTGCRRCQPPVKSLSWSFFSENKEVPGAALTVIKVEKRTRRTATTKYTVECNNCGNFYVLSHNAIEKRIKYKRKTCEACKRETREETEYGEPTVIPPMWPVPNIPE